MKVFTTHGLVDMDALTVRDVVELADNHRKVATEFYLGEELVRRDVAVSLLAPPGVNLIHGDLNGQ
jgi:hypothetical protein